MDRQLQTSFIPKKRREARSIIAKVKRPMTLYSWFSTAIFILALTITIGMYGYERILIGQNGEKKAAIQEEIQAFEPELTEALSNIKSRIDSGKKLLENHLAGSLFFSALEAITLSNVYYDSFSFDTSPGALITVEAGGLAPSYAVLAFQSGVLRRTEFIKDLAFSNLNVNEEGDVTFSLKAELDPEVALYKNIVSGQPPVVIETEEEIDFPVPNEDEVGESQETQ